MPRVKIQLQDGIKRVVTVDTDATKGATLGANVYLPSGVVATPTTFLQWLGTAPSSSSSSSSSSGPSISSILTTKGDLATRDSAVQRLGIGAQDTALRVSAAGMPEWRAGAALTKSNDTNVTLTLGGTPATSLLAAASLTLGWTGTLAAPRGGTGVGVYAVGDLLYADTTASLAKLTVGAAGRWLGAGASAPQWNAPAALTKTDDTNVTLTLGGSASTALLNAAALTLGWTGQLAVARGGTNIASYTAGDLLYATGATTLAKLGIGSAGDVLRVSGGAPAWQATSTFVPAAANPTASVGLTAVNGSATTFLRSDGAPALDQGIAPTWTSQHDFTGLLTHSVAASKISIGQDGSNYSEVRWISSTAPTDAKRWDAYIDAVSGSFSIRAVNDAPSVARQAFAFDRTGVAITQLVFGNSTDNPAQIFFGALTPNAQSLSTGASVPTIGTNKPGSAVALAPSTWWGIVINGTQYYIPLWI